MVTDEENGQRSIFFRGQVTTTEVDEQIEGIGWIFSSLEAEPTEEQLFADQIIKGEGITGSKKLCEKGGTEEMMNYIKTKRVG